MTTPVEWLLENRDAVKAAFDETATVKEAWKTLTSRFPELTNNGIMSENTFRPYSKVLIEVLAHIDINKVRHSELVYLKAERDRLQSELDRLVRHGVKPKAEIKLAKPSKIDGWNIRQAKDGYFRAYRKVRNKLESVYLGKTLDEDAAKEKILNKERQIGIV